MLPHNRKPVRLLWVVFFPLAPSSRVWSSAWGDRRFCCSLLGFLSSILDLHLLFLPYLFKLCILVGFIYGKKKKKLLPSSGICEPVSGQMRGPCISPESEDANRTVLLSDPSDPVWFLWPLFLRAAETLASWLADDFASEISISFSIVS